MSEEMKCPICGEVTSSYMGHYRKDKLCKKHAAELKAERIVQCEECGSWHLVDERCNCSRQSFAELPTEGFDTCVVCGERTRGYAFCRKCFRKYTEEEMLEILNKNADNYFDKSAECQNNYFDEDDCEESVDEDADKNNVIVVDYNNKARCITCGRSTDGLLFCPSCYRKYRNKELLIKITDCTNVELLDADYEGKYVCKDGHVVKSKSEREIDNYLFENGILHAYEKDLPYGASNKEVLRPDFCLQDYLGKGNHVYIEHWGYNENNMQYTKTKKFKMQIYRQLGITLVCTYEKTDMGKIESVLDRKLNKNFIKQNEINDDSENEERRKINLKNYEDDNDMPF